MLKLFQNQGKVLRWIMGVVLFLVAGSMVITLVPNVFGPAGPGSADVLAEVGGLTVTTRDVEVELRQYRSNDTPAEAIAMMAASVVENLIAERVLFVEAASSVSCRAKKTSPTGSTSNSRTCSSRTANSWGRARMRALFANNSAGRS